MRKRALLQTLSLSPLVCLCGRQAFGQAHAPPKVQTAPALLQPPPKFQPTGEQPFCGFSRPASQGGIVPKAYALKGAGRGKSSLTWTFAGVVPGVANPGPILVQAFAKWKVPVPALTFTQLLPPQPGAPLPKADIALGVAALPPPPTGGITLGSTSNDGSTISFNTRATFVPSDAVSPGSTTASLLAVATHEIGHALGLLHATTRASVMWPNNPRNETLGPDDTAAIKALYGWSAPAKLQGGTEQSPAICTCGNTLVMAWRGGGDDRRIYFASSTDGKNWTPQRPIPGAASIGAPGLAWDGTNLWMALRGIGDDQTVYVIKGTINFFQTTTSDAKQKVPNAGSSHGPRIAIVGGVPTLACKGINDDHGIYVARFTGGKWQAPAPVPNIGTETAPAICQDVGGGARLVWRGIGNDRRLWTTYAAGPLPSWQPQQTLSWVVTGNGSAGTTGGGTAGTERGPSLTLVGKTVLAAWRGTGDDQRIWFTQFANDALGKATVGEWSSPAVIPGAGTSQGPSIAAFKGNVFVACKGVENDRGIWLASL